MNKHKILIAEDDQRLARALSERLQSVGYEVAVAADGYNAIAAIKREEPDVLVLDIHMPASDGFTVQQRMNDMPDVKKIPVIYLTGDKSDEAMMHAGQLGACGMIYKPVSIPRLLEAVERALKPRAA